MSCKSIIGDALTGKYGNCSPVSKIYKNYQSPSCPISHSHDVNFHRGEI